MLRALAVALFTTHALTVAAQEVQAPAALPTSTTRLVPVSGLLTNAVGRPLTGRVTVTFSLYDAREDGTILWSETQDVQVDARGSFTAYLGTVTPLPQAAFSQERARWLEVSIEGRAQPRVMLVAVPYALRAADAETLGGTPASDFVRTDATGRRLRADGTTIDDPLVDGSGVPNQLAKWNGATTLSSSVISESATNRIGVGLPDPTGGGVVDSVFTIRNLDNNTGFAVLNQTQQRRFALNTLANGGWVLYDGAGATWNDGLQQFNGMVAIGGSPGGAGLLAVGPSPNTIGVAGSSALASGVQGDSGSGVGVSGFSNTGVGVRGNSVSGTAGQFIGNVTITGTLSKGGGSFTIDHPLDPEHKYLQHSFVESPDMMNVYNGNVVLDADGEGWVMLPDWFQALNRDFRYQLTALGAPGPNLHIASEIAANKFKIAGGTAGGKVSWQVTGIRQDAWANANRIQVEKEKPDGDRGFYLHPTAFDRPPAMALPSARAGGAR